jgi:hypothetical protein
VDVYSLACVLYQCLTGAKPFGGDTAASLINAHLNQSPPVPTAVRSDIPREFDQIVKRGMAKDPADRYASAGELARAARQALTSVTAVPAHLAPVVAAEPQRKSKGGRWVFVLAGVGAVAAVAGVVVLATTLRTEQGLPVPVSDPSALQETTAEAQPPPASLPDSEPPPAPPLPPPALPMPSAAQPPPVVEKTEPPAPEPQEPSEEPEKPPSTPVQTKWCQSITFDGAVRGTGCFEAYGDHLFAHDTKADGMWIKTVAETDYGRVVECKDAGAEGGPIDCDFDMSEKGRIHFKVELWDGQTKISETSWSKFVPISQ